MEHKAIYKCRLCGEVYENGVTTGTDLAMRTITELAIGLVCTLPMAPRMTEVHACGGEYAGSMGLADFQGWKAKEEKHD